MPEFDYVRDGAEIYRQSFATIRAEAELDRFPADLAQVVVRMIHSCGMTDLPRDVACSDGLVGQARTALQGGAPIAHCCSDPLQLNVRWVSSQTVGDTTAQTVTNIAVIFFISGHSFEFVSCLILMSLVTCRSYRFMLIVDVQTISAGGIALALFIHARCDK